MLKISSLEASISPEEGETKQILRGITLDVPAGEVHAIMGPNGSGKSTLGYVLAGNEGYEVTGGSVSFEGADLLAMEPEERAAAGLFLAFQAPVELPGVNNANFLRTALNAVRRSRGEEELDAVGFLRLARAESKRLHFPDDMLKRNVNVGFSGGEKKRNEVLQMAILRPKMAVLDETDSGLDIDALRIVADGVNALRGPAFLGPGDHAPPAAAGAPGAGPGARVEPGPHHPLGRAGAGAGVGGERLRPGGGGRGMNQLAPTGAEAFLARYRGLRDRLPGDPVQRDQAAEAFERAGLPTPKNEAWHYTSLRGLGDTPFQEPLTEVSAAPELGPMPDLPRLVLVDGRYHAGLSTPPDGVQVTTFAERPAFGQSDLALPMVAMNTMLAEDGVQLRVAAGVDAGTLLLLNAAPDGHRPIDFHPRHQDRPGGGCAVDGAGGRAWGGDLSAQCGVRGRSGVWRGADACAAAGGEP